MTISATYALLLKLSAQMADAAERQDLEALSGLQTQRNALLATLPKKLPALSIKDIETVRQLIQGIQAHDLKIMKYVMPWREQVGQLIANLPPVA